MAPFSKLRMMQLVTAAAAVAAPACAGGGTIRHDRTDADYVGLSAAHPQVGALISSDQAGATLVLSEDDPLLEDLLCPPTGDGSVPLFHVKSDRHQHFERKFLDRYGDKFALLSSREVEDLRLLGPGRLTPRARRRFGDYIAIAPEPATLHYQCSEKHPAFRGIHSGLRPGEMRIPLVLS